MEIIGYNGLIATFGGDEKAWKQRLAEGMPVKVRQAAHSGKPHTFNSKDIHDWLLKKATGFESLDVNQERAALFRVQRQRQELALSRERGELIELKVAEEWMARHIGMAKIHLMGLPRRVAGLLALPFAEQARIENLVDEVVRSALTALADAMNTEHEKAFNEPKTDDEKPNC